MAHKMRACWIFHTFPSLEDLDDFEICVITYKSRFNIK